MSEGALLELVKRVEVLSLRPGDVVVVSLDVGDSAFGDSNIEGFRDLFRETLARDTGVSDLKVVVLVSSGGAKFGPLQVVRVEDPQQALLDLAAAAKTIAETPLAPAP